MKRLPEIECPKCKGKGHVELPTALSETMQAVKAAGKTTAFICIESISKKLPKVKKPALRERLRLLVSHGLLGTEKIGTVTFYTITSKK